MMEVLLRAGTVEVLLMAVAALVIVTVILAISIILKLNRITRNEPLTRDVIGQLLRAETDLVRRSGDDQARGIRDELADRVRDFQENTSRMFSVYFDGMNGQIRNFGERLDGGIKAIEQKVHGIGEKLDADIAQMGDHAERNREALRSLIEGKLDSTATKQSEEAKNLREELGQSFQRVSGNLTSTLNEMSERQKERLEVAQVAIDTLGKKLDADIAQMGESAERNRENLRVLIEAKLDGAATKQTEEAKSLREELNQSFHRLGGHMATTLTEMGERQKERLEKTTNALDALSEKNERSSEALKQAVEARLDTLRQENSAKLDEMRQTVDEKLQSTLETRLGESFNRVVEQLNRVHEGLGEMKNLASNVGDLKNVLTNVKVRGTFGEVQLEMLLEQFLTRDQYIKDARVKEGTTERVEFAIRFPGKIEGADVLLPIDAKFPRETYDRLLEASQAADEDAVKLHRKQLETQVRACAKDICSKYINPPTTTDFAILFLPTEGLYAEVLRQVGVFESLQRDYKVTLAGPTTLSAILNALQMGFRSLAIEKRSGEVWQVLGAVQTEFGKYNAVVDKLASQLQTAANSVESLGRRTRAMNRRLKTVEKLPDGAATAALLGFDGEDLGLLPGDGLVPDGGGNPIVLPPT
jgi:DNA recombination protein RmuC